MCHFKIFNKYTIRKIRRKTESIYFSVKISHLFCGFYYSTQEEQLHKLRILCFKKKTHTLKKKTIKQLRMCIYIFIPIFPSHIHNSFFIIIIIIFIISFSFRTKVSTNITYFCCCSNKIIICVIIVS